MSCSQALSISHQFISSIFLIIRMSSILLYAGEVPKATPPLPSPSLDSSMDVFEGQEMVTELLKNEQHAFLFAWVEKAKSPLSLGALETAVALLLRPDSRTLQELNEYRPEFTEQSLGRMVGPILRIADGKVSFANQSVKAFFDQNRPLDDVEPWQGKDWELTLARACITYLALDDFRDLPLPQEFKGFRSDLQHSDHFLTYASCQWHHHVSSAEEASVLEPALDAIIDPTRNNLYLWTDQSSGSSGTGPRGFFRSRSEVAIKRDIEWLALYLLDSTSSEPELVFPARDLKLISRKAPSIFNLLIRMKPQYYLPAVTKSVLTGIAWLQDHAFEVLQTLYSHSQSLNVPFAFLGRVPSNKDAVQILELLCSKIDNMPMTRKMLAAAAANRDSSALKFFFEREPSIRVDASMMSAAISVCDSTDNFRLLFEHDTDAPVTEDTLMNIVQMEIKPEKFRFLLNLRPNIQITPKLLTEAVRLNRSETVKLMYETDKALEINEEILKIAMRSGGFEIYLAEYLLDRCDPTLVTADVLLAAVECWSWPNKVVELVLRRNSNLEISDTMLIKAAVDWDGKILDRLLEQQERQIVPTELVDKAVEAKKSRLSWSWHEHDENEPSVLKTLQARVPNDPYLRKVLDETDFSPPIPKSPTESIPATALPDAASDSNVPKVLNLLDQGADIDTQCGRTCGCDRNKGVGTALQRATKHRDVEMVRVLLEKGANPNLQEGAYGNPLQEASMAGDLEIVKLLVRHKAQVNLQGGKYRSPLSAAARANDVKITSFLLDSGADINIADNHGWTPYLYAVAHESHEVARYLLSVDSSLAALGELIALHPGMLTKAKDSSTVDIGEDGITVNTGMLGSGSCPIKITDEPSCHSCRRIKCLYPNSWRSSHYSHSTFLLRDGNRSYRR